MKVIKNKKYAIISVTTLAAVGTLLYIFPPHFAATNAAQDCSSGCTNQDNATNVSAEWQWSVDVKETLTMTVENQGDDGKNKGAINKFLYDKVKVSVTSNNGKGFTAGMTTSTDSTQLTNSTNSQTANINTLTSDATVTGTDGNYTGMTNNTWGYMIHENGNGGDSAAGTYKKMVGTNEAPITVLSDTKNPDSGTKEGNVYFGMQADSFKLSGKYTGNVVFTVTSGTNGAQLPKPGAAADPGGQEGPSTDPPAPEMGPSESPSPSQSGVPSNSYAYSTGGQTYQSSASSMMESTGANRKKRSSASDFVSPLGVNERSNGNSSTVSNIQHGSTITTVLMVVAFLAAGIGIFFFILAKKRDEDEDEEEV